MMGRTDNNRVVNFAGPAAVGALIDVEITAASAHTLRGTVSPFAIAPALAA